MLSNIYVKIIGGVIIIGIIYGIISSVSNAYSEAAKVPSLNKTIEIKDEEITKLNQDIKDLTTEYLSKISTFEDRNKNYANDNANLNSYIDRVCRQSPVVVPVRQTTTKTSLSASGDKTQRSGGGYGIDDKELKLFAADCKRDKLTAIDLQGAINDLYKAQEKKYGTKN